MTHFLGVISLVLYLLLFIFALLAIFKGKTTLARSFILFEFFAFVVLLVTAVQIYLGQSRVNDWAWLMWKVSLVLSLVGLLLKKKYSYPILSALLFPAIIWSILSSSIVWHQFADSVSPSIQTYLFHVFPAVLALSFQILLILTALAYLVFSSALKNKKAWTLKIPTPGLRMLFIWQKYLILALCFVASLTFFSGALNASGLILYDSLSVLGLLSLLGNTALLYLFSKGNLAQARVSREALLFNVLILTVFFILAFLPGKSIHIYDKNDGSNTRTTSINYRT